MTDTGFDDGVWEEPLPSLSFDGEPPITHIGTVLSQRQRQQTKYGSGEPIFWPDGNPALQQVVTVADAEGVEANLYVNIPSNLLRAIRGAVKVQRVRGLRRGDLLSVTFIGWGEAEKGKQPPKEYVAILAPGEGTIPPDPFAEDGDPSS
jgi:hypothetical protein